MPRSISVEGLTPDRLWVAVSKAQTSMEDLYAGLTKPMVFLWHLHMDAALEAARAYNIHPRRIQVCIRSVPGVVPEAVYLEGSGVDATCWRMPTSEDAGHWDENPLHVVSRLYRPGDLTIEGLKREGSWLSLT